MRVLLSSGVKVDPTVVSRSLVGAILTIVFIGHRPITASTARSSSENENNQLVSAWGTEKQFWLRPKPVAVSPSLTLMKWPWLFGQLTHYMSNVAVLCLQLYMVTPASQRRFIRSSRDTRARVRATRVSKNHASSYTTPTANGWTVSSDYSNLPS